MRFFDREQEFEKLREIEEMSHEVAQFTIITGRRRIGKTEMVKKFYENKPMLYFFVARKAEADLCEIFVDEVSSKLGIPIIGKVNSFATIRAPLSAQTAVTQHNVTINRMILWLFNMAFVLLFASRGKAYCTSPRIFMMKLPVLPLL